MYCGIFLNSKHRDTVVLVDRCDCIGDWQMSINVEYGRHQVAAAACGSGCPAKEDGSRARAAGRDFGAASTWVGAACGRALGGPLPLARMHTLARRTNTRE